MKLKKFEDASKLYKQVQDYLLKYEAENCLVLGIINNLINHPNRYESQPYLAVVEKKENIVAVAVRTPPRRLLLSKIADLDAVEVMVKDLYNYHQPLPGVSGMATEAQAFVQSWQAVTGQSYHRGMQLRIHKLNTVQPIAKTRGFLRPATEDDFDLLLDWYKAFYLEAVGTIEGDEERTLRHHLRQNILCIWEDEVPVSMACGRVSTANGCMIGPVYTPPKFRRNGYATACVAALSQSLLDKGYSYCYLFTDLANPTSNHIYKMIGYQGVCDWHDYALENAEY